MALEAYLRAFQMSGSEVMFRTGLPVQVKVSISIRTEGTLTLDQTSALEDYVDDSILSQCFKLGGTFDVSELSRAIVEHEHVKTVFVHTPRNNNRLSWIGYFSYDPVNDPASIEYYTGDALPEQGVDRYTGPGYCPFVAAERVRLGFIPKPKAERVVLGFAPVTRYAIPSY